MKINKIDWCDYVICVIFFIFSFLYIKYYTPKVSAEPPNVNIESQVQDSIIQDSLIEWQIFIMALIEVECERNPNVKSHKGAVGPFQITQVYINEINRLYSTNFVLQDAYDLNKALSIFEMMNDYYNPDRNIDKAIELHNPGAGHWYNKKIKQRMQLIRFNEKVRSAIIDLYNMY